MSREYANLDTHLIRVKTVEVTIRKINYVHFCTFYSTKTSKKGVFFYVNIPKKSFKAIYFRDENLKKMTGTYNYITALAASDPGRVKTF